MNRNPGSNPSGREAKMSVLIGPISGKRSRTIWTILVGLLLAFPGCKIDHGLSSAAPQNGDRVHITFNTGVLGFVLVTETVAEGETYVIPNIAIPEPFGLLQVYWDAFEGATMTIPFGALNQDIVVNIWVSNFDLATLRFNDLAGEKIFLSLDFEVEGYEEEVFLFNAAYVMEFRLPLDEEMLPLLQLSEFDLSTRLTMAYWTGSEFGVIPTIQSANGLMGKVPHLCTIVGKKAVQY
jgi:hypothetical protein